MKITINGEQEQVRTDITVSELLVEKEVKMPDMVSVELNADILDREDFNTALKEDDTVEFLYFMGGGAVENNYLRK